MSDGHSRSEYFGQVGVPRRLGERFYDVPCEDLAMSLLGKVLVRQLDDGTVVKGRIVETESYPGGEDVASHSFNGRVTTRNEPMFMKPGTAYVYMTYGMYHCFNISSKGDGAAVLLRSIEPLYNSETMTSLRKKFRKSPNAVIKSKDLCNGPAKLCLSFAIDIKSCNKQDLTSWNGMWVEEDEQSGLADTIVCSPRIGIKCEKEWQDKFLRFYILDSPFVSHEIMFNYKKKTLKIVVWINDKDPSTLLIESHVLIVKYLHDFFPTQNDNSNLILCSCCILQLHNHS